MTTSEILSLDFRKEENKRKIQKVIKKIKPFSKYEDDVPVSEIEKFLLAVCNKYCVCIQYLFFPNHNAERIYYSCSVKRDDTNEWVGSVQAVEIYEVFAKLAIMLYSVVKKGEIPKR